MRENINSIKYKKLAKHIVERSVADLKTDIEKININPVEKEYIKLKKFLGSVNPYSYSVGNIGVTVNFTNGKNNLTDVLCHIAEISRK